MYCLNCKALPGYLFLKMMHNEVCIYYICIYLITYIYILKIGETIFSIELQKFFSKGLLLPVNWTSSIF